MTRRSLLAAGVAGTVGAGSVVATDPHRARRWLHSAGLLDGPDTALPNVPAPVDYYAFDSTAMERRVQWGLAVPTRAATAMVVCLHGRGNSHRFAFETMGVHRFVRAAALPWAVASANGGADSYWHARADGTDAQAMVFHELVPMVRARVGQVPVGVLGWSMGGYGALLAAADRRNDVAAAVASSPAVWESFASSAPGAFDDRRDFEAHDVFARIDALRQKAIRIDCGEDDPFIGAARTLAARLPHAATDFGAGFHDAASWRHRLPSQLRFLHRVLTG